MCAKGGGVRSGGASARRRTLGAPVGVGVGAAESSDATAAKKVGTGGVLSAWTSHVHHKVATLVAMGPAQSQAGKAGRRGLRL